MEAEIAARESADRANDAMQRLDGTIKKFRANLQNDLSSMKAASERVQNEVRQMEQKYGACVSLLTSHDFERAIANAERMATALKAISELSETKLSVAVFSGSQA